MAGGWAAVPLPLRLLALLLLPAIVRAAGPVSTSVAPEPVQAIDKINISAFVSDFSDASVENSSEVWQESVDVSGKDAGPLYPEGPEEEEGPGQPFAGSRGLVSNYRLTVLVEHLAEGREYTVEETHNSEDEISQLTVQDPLRNATSTCTLHTNGFGFATTGVRCRTNRNLPQECFCWDGICSHPYYPFSRLLAPLARATLRPAGPAGLLQWTFPDPEGPAGGDNPDRLSLTGSLRLVSGSWLLPLSLSLRGAAYSLGAQGSAGEQEWARLRYTVLQFRPLEPVRAPGPGAGRLPAPRPGIFCPRSSTHLDSPLPALPSQFSVQIESQEVGGRRVSYAHHHYHLPHRLVSMQVAGCLSPASELTSSLAGLSPAAPLLHLPLPLLPRPLPRPLPTPLLQHHPRLQLRPPVHRQ
jgi:hypothetical protein